MVLEQATVKGLARVRGLELAEWLNRPIVGLCFLRMMPRQLKNTRRGSPMKGCATLFSFFPKLTILIPDLPPRWPGTWNAPLDKLPNGHLQQIAVAVRLLRACWQGSNRTNATT
ncbi:hypothetical protein [Aquisediminimonas profunda]|uniref:hypothetical protein n=1 Tax=Aquisediminimonas profunda TaxID=1550733 RepID=UPI001C634153|nr:hypothetical protein [Aquisediminimonas profunda]